MIYKERLTREQALQKLRQFCGYQERCHQDVKEKLYSIGMKKPDIDAITSQLIEENYLNEERFAVAFAGGRFRVKEWGRIKIRYELRQREISDYCITKALQEVKEPEYTIVLSRVARERFDSLEGTSLSSRLRKTIDYLIARGFERDRVYEVTSEIGKRLKESKPRKDR